MELTEVSCTMAASWQLVTLACLADTPKSLKQVRVSHRILSWGKQGGSRMIVVCEMHACLLGGSGGMPPQENFESIYLSDCF